MTHYKYLVTQPIPVTTTMSIPGQLTVIDLREKGIFYSTGIIFQGSLDAQNFIITFVEGIIGTPRANVISRITIAGIYNAGRIGGGFLFPTVTRFDTTNKVFSAQWDSNGLEFEGVTVTVTAGPPQLDTATSVTVSYTYLLKVFGEVK